MRPFVPTLRRESVTSIRLIRRLIRVQDVDIIFAANPLATVPHHGIGGYTPNEHLVLIWLNPRHPKFLSKLKTQLGRTLAHELHHALRWKSIGYGKTLLEALVTEGLADHFELEVFNGKPELHDVVLSDSQRQNLLNRARTEFKNSYYSHDDWFFGSKHRKIPKWTGYALGFSIVGKYLQAHPHQRPSQLVKTPAKNFSTSA